MIEVVHPYLEIFFRPTVATINEARRMVAALCGGLLHDPDATSRIALTTHELLENALKYSLDGSTVIRIELGREAQPSGVLIETRNPASPERREGLVDVFAEMKDAGDPASYYQFVMRRTRTLKNGSGLGLARIWAEGEMNLTCNIEGDEVRITAAGSTAGAKS